MAGQAGRVVTREEIRAALWTSDTFVDFEQGVNFAIKQVREALGEDADHPIYIQTIPKRGYKFVAPVEVVGSQAVQAPPQARTDGTLSKLLWSHIADLRIAEDRRKKRRRAVLIGVSVAIGVALIATIVVLMMRVDALRTSVRRRLLLRRRRFRREECRGLRRHPVEQVARFHEAAGVRARAEDDDRDLLAALRQPQQRRQAVARLRDEAGLARAHVDVAAAAAADSCCGR